jgi:site-specific DNA recombinase
MAYPTEILDSKFEQNQVWYLIQWKGYTQPTWEPERHIKHRTDLLDAYHETQTLENLRIGTSGCYLYCRVSKRPLPNAPSLEVQEAAMRKYCEEQDLEVLGVVKEIYSATNMSRLRGLQYLCTCVSSGQHILVYDVSRFSRNVREALNLLEQLKRRNVRVRAVEESIVYGDTASGRNYFRLQLCASEYYTDLISTKVRASISHRRLRGDYIGRAPFGYRLGTVDGRKVLVAHEEEKKVVDRIRRLRRRGVRAIVDCLRDEGVRIRGHLPTVVNVHRILVR